MADLADGAAGAAPPSDGHVVVTGAQSPAGRALALRLAAQGAVVVALEDTGAPAPGPAGQRTGQHDDADDSAQDDAQDDAGAADDDAAAGGRLRRVRVDLTAPDVLAAMSGAQPPAAVVHVALDSDLRAALAVPAATRRERAEASVRAVVTAAAAAGARRLVLVSSAMVHGALPDAPVPLPDDAPLLAAPDDGLVGDLLAVEEVWARAARALPGVPTAVLRPAAVVGPGVDTVVTRSFEVPRLLALRERAPVWQFCHVDDLAAAVAVVLREGLTGAMGAGADGVLVHEALERSSGLRSVELPARLAHATAERLARLGLLPTPAGDLAFVVHPWAVSSERLRAAGWRPEHGNEECLAVLLEDVRERRAARRGATAGPRLPSQAALGAAGAAGAAVAVVATAAVLRQARARRGR